MYISNQGYRIIYAPNHSRAHKDGMVMEHLVIAEKALGKPLPKTASVHHFNENKLDNKNSNLIICQDEAYHQLLHVRKRIVDAGGNPDTDKICSTCGQSKHRMSFYSHSGLKSDGRASQCKVCCRRLANERNARNKAKKVGEPAP